MAFFVTTAVLISSGNNIFAQNSTKDRESDAAQLRQISAACETAKRAAVQEIMTPAATNPKTDLLREMVIFRGNNTNAMPRQKARDWEERLKLTELQRTLRQEESDLALIDEALEVLAGKEPELQRPQFVRLKKSLERNLDLLERQNRQLNQEEVEALYDSLPGLVENYLKSPNAENANAVSETLSLMDGSRQADELITLVRKLLVRPNLKLRVRSEMLEPLFYRDIDEPVNVNDTILGTNVRGSGQLSGRSTAAFVPSRDSGVIRVTLKGELTTSTVGTSGPVRVHSNNATAITTVKDIILTKDSIATTYASTDARQASRIGHVSYTRRGPFVQMIAPNQIRNRKPATDAESERMTQRRFNTRVDAVVDENVSRFNETLSKMAGGRPEELRLDFGRLETTKEVMLIDGVVGNRYQMTTMTEAPAVETQAGLFVQVHESLADNAGTCELSGRSLVEDEIMAKLKERFPKIAGENDGNDPSLTIAFSDRPIAMSFADNCIRATVETAEIERGGSSYPGMVIEFQFRIEAAKEGFLLTAVEAPEVLPLGFDRENGHLSARETTIRAIIMKKLERITEKPIEWKESTIEGKNGNMTLKPVYLSTTDGWLSLGLDLVEWTPVPETDRSITL